MEITTVFIFFLGQVYLAKLTVNCPNKLEIPWKFSNRHVALQVEAELLRRVFYIHLPLATSPQGFCPFFPYLSQAFALILSPSHLSKPWTTRRQIHKWQKLMHKQWRVSTKASFPSYSIIDLIIVLEVINFAWQDMDVNMGYRLSWLGPVLRF